MTTPLYTESELTLIAADLRDESNVTYIANRLAEICHRHDTRAASPLAATITELLALMQLDTDEAARISISIDAETCDGQKHVAIELLHANGQNAHTAHFNAAMPTTGGRTRAMEHFAVSDTRDGAVEGARVMMVGWIKEVRE